MPLLIEPTCLVCGESIGTANPYLLYCCNAHRQAAYRARASTPRKALVHHVRNHTQRTTKQVLDRQQAVRDRRRNARLTTQTPNKRPRRRRR